jgi:hypothetical protein
MLWSVLSVLLVLCLHSGVSRQVHAGNQNGLYGNPFLSKGCSEKEIKFTFAGDEFPENDSEISVCAPLCADVSRRCEPVEDRDLHLQKDQVIPSCILSVPGAPAYIRYYCGVLCKLSKNPQDTAGCMEGAVCLDMGFGGKEDENGHPEKNKPQDGLCVYMPP